MTADGKYPETDPEQDGDRSGENRTAAGEPGERRHAEPLFSVAVGEIGTPAGRNGDSSTDCDPAAPASPVDSDYGDDSPGVPGAAAAQDSAREGPDPGYKAFADELDDPLADWPAPDTDLHSLPEMQTRDGADRPESAQRDPFADDLPSDSDAPPSRPENDAETAGAVDRLAMEAADDAFVDDFLADLDDLDDLAPDTQPARHATGPDGADDGATDAGSMNETRGDRVSAEAEGKPGLPWGIVAVVALALLLLAAGGVGVVQQRSSLKAEVRDLQARLATAVAPEEAAAERERQRQIELQNASLAAEIAALEAENEALGDRLASLEKQLEEQLAAQESAGQDAQAAAQASAPRAQSAAREPAAPADVPGWFVNFGSYAQQAIAQRLADGLEVSGGSVVVQEARASGRTLYRVRVVGLPTRDAAERVATTLERQHQLPRLWVGRN